MPPLISIKPYWTTRDGDAVKLYNGDVLKVLRGLPSESVHCVITSPPYWALRDYGTGEWEGGDPECDHSSGTVRNDKGSDTLIRGGAKEHGAGIAYYKNKCGKCGAKRIDQQLGSESLHDCGGWASGERCGACHVCVITNVFREVYRVLRDDGTLWLNYGDTYANSGACGGSSPVGDRRPRATDKQRQQGMRRTTGLTPGNLTGIPWRVALSLQAEGWILRQDIIWSKPNPMPESVRNRCTKSHEYIFLFAKTRDYFYDQEAIREKSIVGYVETPNGVPNGNRKAQSSSLWRHAGDAREEPTRNVAGEQTDCIIHADHARNKRSVWAIASQGYPGAHFATFPPKLIVPMILAGTSEFGCCAECQAPYRRVTETTQLKRERPNDYVKYAKERGIKSGLNTDRGDGGRSNVGGVNSCANSVAGVSTKTVGWEPSCECDCDETIPCVVLDPFVGSGTVNAVAIDKGRRSIGIDLNANYLDKNAIPRITGELLSRPSLSHLIPRGD